MSPEGSSETCRTIRPSKLSKLWYMGKAKCAHVPDEYDGLFRVEDIYAFERRQFLKEQEPTFRVWPTGEEVNEFFKSQGFQRRFAPMES